MSAASRKGDHAFALGLLAEPLLIPEAPGQLQPPAGRQVFVNAEPIACVGDDVVPDLGPPALTSVASGSSAVFVGCKAVARQGDTTTKAGKILTGFKRVDVGR